MSRGFGKLSEVGGHVVSESENDSKSEIGPPRYSRRLSDKILIAFHHACDQGDYEIAEKLLHVLELMLTRRPSPAEGNRRRTIESLVAAHERLWMLRHPEHRPE
jgi:hypothetical protein